MVNNRTSEQSNEYNKEDVKKIRKKAAWSYLFFLLPYLDGETSSYVLFHSKEGLKLLMNSLLVAMLCLVITMFFKLNLGYTILIHMIWFLPTIYLILLGTSNAMTGKTKKLPIIREFKVLKEEKNK